MEQLLASLESFGPLNDELKSALTHIIKEKRYVKGHRLLSQGQRCDKVWFIRKGIAGCFYEKNEKTQCAWFVKENDFCTSLTCFLAADESSEDIIALDDLETLYINRNDLIQLYNRFPELISHATQLLIHFCITNEQRMRAFHNQPPVNRYLFLMENEPELITRLMVKDIARYLGMHPDALSKLRSSIG